MDRVSRGRVAPACLFSRPCYVSLPDHFDLVVIGSGPAGEKGAAQAAYFGKRVCLIERAPKPGGAAVNTGTIPSKTLRETALYFSGLRQRGLYGVDLTREAEHHDRRLHASRARGDRDGMGAHRREHREAPHHHAAGCGALHRCRTRSRSRATASSRGASPATSSSSPPAPRPMAPVGYAIDGEVVVDSDSLLTLQRIPPSMIVVGGGVIGCEYACIFAALGVRVTLVNARGRLLAHLDQRRERRAAPVDDGEARRQRHRQRRGAEREGREWPRAGDALRRDHCSAPTPCS